ncbi:hypothetical protein NVP1236O_31 [Vibrio phage 1.236.O._10N.261.52.C4]|nr:hypothetical protein NVP1236O_31 [Vibrio phage 1.236.O._10N.261.52.C4]
MSCEDYPTAQTAKTFKLDAETVNEVVTLEQDRTSEASDGKTKKTLWGIETDATNQRNEFEQLASDQRDNFEVSFSSQFNFKRIGNISDYAGQSLPEADKLNSYQYPDDSGDWYVPEQGQSFPITIPEDPTVAGSNWLLQSPSGVYRGLWPDTGGSANKGDTYQTQTGGTPTGQYFTALKNTTAAPVGDDVNWREVVSVNVLSATIEEKILIYTDIVHKASGGNSAVDNMIANATMGEHCKCENGTNFKRISTSNSDITDFKYLSGGNLLDFSGSDAVGFDSTQACQLMADTCGIVDSKNYTNPVEIGVVTTTRKTKFNMPEVLMLDTSSVEVAFNLNHADSEFKGNINGGGGYRSAVNLNADRCKFDGYVHNLESTADSTNWMSGVEINSGEGCRVKARMKNLVRSGNNDSVPRSVTAQGTSKDWHIELLDCEDVNGGLSQTTNGTFDFIKIINATDNGLYNLGGEVKGSYLMYKGSEEAIVHKGICNITDVDYEGDGLPIGYEDGDALWIGNLHLKGQATQVVRSRPGNSITNKIEIDSITGDASTKQLFGTSVGQLKKFIVKDIDLICPYNRSEAFLPFVSLSGVLEYHIKNWKVRVIDLEDAISGSTRLQMSMPGSLDSDPDAPFSTVENIDFFLYASDGVTKSPGEFRITGLAQDKVFAKGIYWQTNIGPYGREATWSNGVRDSTTSGVVAGKWKAGTDLINSTATSAPFRRRCTVSGEPGTWVAY